MRIFSYIIFFFVLLCLFVPTEARADFYTYTDSSGVLHITDTPKSKKFNWFMAERSDKKKPVYTSYDNIIREMSKKYGVDPVLVRAIVKVESDFNPNVVSSKGATGLMQLMPATAKLMGVKDIFDPRENIEGGVKYLFYLMNRFSELKLVIAAYNAGETAVRKYNKIPPYKETRNYVKKVLAYQKIFAKIVR